LWGRMPNGKSGGHLPGGEYVEKTKRRNLKLEPPQLTRGGKTRVGRVGWKRAMSQKKGKKKNTGGKKKKLERCLVGRTNEKKSF